MTLSIPRLPARQVWVKWDHPDTLPNPSLESADSLKAIKGTSSPA